MNLEEITFQEFNKLCSEQGVYKIHGSSKSVKVVLQDLNCLVCAPDKEGGFDYFFFPDIKSAEVAFPEDL